MQIRTAKPEDTDPLSAVIAAAYAPFRATIPDLPAVEEGIAEDIRDNLVFVAEGDTGILGGLVLVLKPDFALLANVAVSPAASGQGIGKALIEKAEVECRQRGLGEIRLATHTAMPQNVRLYERLGWRVSETSGNKVLMSKAL